MRLCTKCASLNFESMLSGTGQKHHGSLGSLKTSSVTCCLCKYFLAALLTDPAATPLQESDNTTPNDIMINVESTQDGRIESLAVRMDLPILGIQTQHWVLQELWGRPVQGRLLLLQDRSTTLDDNGRSASETPQGLFYTLPRSSGDSPVDFETIKSWVRECVGGDGEGNHPPHVECETPAAPVLPTRVIDIGPWDGVQVPRLVESKGRRAPYIALSHCWGGHVGLTTTTPALSERMSGIPIDSMPKTFQDAVYIARNLEVRYLWVDSLCIIQDSPSDWKSESNKMADVYSNCLVTIAAAGATDAAKGCFVSRMEVPAVALPSPDASGFFAVDPAFSMETPSTCPLDTRAWVWQEIALSPRTIYYGTQQIFWECRAVLAFQNCHAPELSRIIDFHGRKDYFSPFALQCLEPRSQPTESTASEDLGGFSVSPTEVWTTIVREYTRRSLTFASDMLPALAGGATTFQRATGWTYLGGLWKENLLATIAWYRFYPGKEIPGTCVPSWTWAASQGPVWFEEALYEGLDPEQSGHLHYATPLAVTKSQFQRTGQVDCCGGLSEPQLEVEGLVLEGLVAKSDRFGVGVTVAGSGERSDVYFDTEEARDRMKDGEPVFLLVVRAEKTPDLKDQIGSHAVTLLLAKDYSGANRYRRLGVAFLLLFESLGQRDDGFVSRGLLETGSSHRLLLV